MSYRPQFAYATPPGCRDEDFVYFFDGSNVPLLNQSLYANSEIPYIPLPLDQDAPFYWRGWKCGIRHLAVENVCPPVVPSVTVSYQLPDFQLKLRDCYDNDLMDSMVDATECGFPQNPLSFLSGLLTGPPVPLESEIYCPRGGVLQLFLRGGGTLGSPTDTHDIQFNFVSLSFYGVKRYKECKG